VERINIGANKVFFVLDRRTLQLLQSLNIHKFIVNKVEKMELCS
jgi:hypothetical protein